MIYWPVFTVWRCYDLLVTSVHSVEVQLFVDQCSQCGGTIICWPVFSVEVHLFADQSLQCGSTTICWPGSQYGGTIICWPVFTVWRYNYLLTSIHSVDVQLFAEQCSQCGGNIFCWSVFKMWKYNDLLSMCLFLVWSILFAHHMS